MSVHLLVLIHGMWGNPAHLAEMSRIIKEVKGSEEASQAAGEIELDVLLAQTNRETSTYDGIDWGGERVADEVGQRVKELEAQGKTVTKISVSGYSLGGLVARYLVGILHQRNFFTKVKPVNFATFATPHIGLIRYPSFFSWLTHVLGPRVLSRTGEQFFTADKWSVTDRSLIEVMADPKEIFYQALTLFEHIHFYGNAVNDRTVPYPSALIEPNDPFVNRAKTGMDVEFDPKYDPIILSYRLPDKPPVVVKPKPLSKAWFARMKPTSILPPPLANLSFPLNYVAVLLLPVIIPTFFTLIILRLSLHSRSSRKRIRLLEKDEQSAEMRLVNAFRKFERELEETMVEMAEDDFGPDEDRTPAVTPNASDSKLLNVKTSEANGDSKIEHEYQDGVVNGHGVTIPPSSAPDSSSSTGQPTLTSAQLQMVRTLNALPRMQKHMAYIDPMRNSHATIVARDVANYAFHTHGWGVLGHWADGFEL